MRKVSIKGNGQWRFTVDHSGPFLGENRSKGENVNQTAAASHDSYQELQSAYE